jgi:hypothetical protein
MFNTFNPANILAILAAGPALVTFEKKDGTFRTMRCTRNPDLMPAGAVKGTDTRKDQGRLIAVWDLDAGAWKGFFFDKMVGFSISDGIARGA